MLDLRDFNMDEDCFKNSLSYEPNSFHMGTVVND